jgi:hypothetical protein
MTLMVTISVPQAQSFGAKVEVIDQYGDKDPVVAQEVELQPGQCFQPYLTNCRSFKVTEIPLKKE